MKTIDFIKKEIVLLLMIAAAFVFAFIFWNQLPERIPTHWNMNGKVNGYSSKGIGLLLIPLMNLGLYFLLLFLPRIDPRKANYPQFASSYKIIRIAIHTLLSLLFILTILYAIGYPINMGFIGKLIIPILFLILGNIMGKIRPNFFIGVRTPWTLSNEEVWVKTHRLTGRVWVISSFIYLFTSLSFNLPGWAILIYVCILIFVPIIYSYIKYQEIAKN